MPAKKSLFLGIFEGLALAFRSLLRYSPMRPEFLRRENRVISARGWSRLRRDGTKIQEERQKKWQLSQ